MVGDDGAKIVKTAAGARFHGLNRCGAHHVCPFCSMAFRAKWAGNISWLMKTCGQQGRHALFLTATIPHNAGDDERWLMDMLSKAWSSLFSGRKREYLERVFALWSYVKALDHTFGAHGYHPHLHGIIWLDRPLTPEEEALLSATLFNAWRRTVERLTGRDCTSQAWRLEQVSDHMSVGNYLTKLAGIPYELTSSATKTRGGRTIWGILRDISRADRAGDEPDPADVRRWTRYVVAIKGRRAIDLGGKARALLRDRPDEEPSESELLAVVGPKTYRGVREGGLQGPLLAAFEGAGARARAEAASLLAEAEREATRSGAIGWVRAAIRHLAGGLPP